MANTGRRLVPRGFLGRVTAAWSLPVPQRSSLMINRCRRRTNRAARTDGWTRKWITAP